LIMLTKLKALPALATMAGAMVLAPMLTPAPSQAAGCGTYTVTELLGTYGAGGDTIDCGDKSFYSFSDIDFGPDTTATFADLGTTHTLTWNFSTPLAGPAMFLGKYTVEPIGSETILDIDDTVYSGSGPVSPNLVTSITGDIWDVEAGIDLGPSATLSSWTNTIQQTPGPLPILGAGAAFGFSRKLRRRIKSVV
jgi:hypothetical protein